MLFKNWCAEKFPLHKIVGDLYQDLAKLDILFSGSDLAGFVCGFSKFRSRSSPRRLYSASYRFWLSYI